MQWLKFINRVPSTLGLRTPSVAVVIASICTAVSANGSIHARYVRIEAPASSRMGLHEIEVWGKAGNLVLKNKHLKFSGVGHMGGDINERNRGWALIDGIAKLDARSPEFSTDGALNPWVELDFGADRNLDRIVIKSTTKPIFDDRALRLVTVLDSDRHVLWSVHYDIRRSGPNNGIETFRLNAGTESPLVGRHVPPKASQWAPLSDLVQPVAITAVSSTERLERFRKRDSRTAIA